MSDSIDPGTPVTEAPTISAPPDLSSEFTNSPETSADNATSGLSEGVPDSVGDTSTPDSNISEGTKELGSFFGVAPEQLSSDETAAAALLPAIEQLEQLGQSKVQAPPPAPQVQQFVAQNQTSPPAPTTPEPTPEFSIDSIDFGETAPEVVSAFKELHSHTQKELQRIQAEATTAIQAAEQIQQNYQGAHEQQIQAQQAEVTSRAMAHLDSMASAKYGVGQNRTMIQNMQVRNVMETAGNLIRGMSSYGGQTPTIERVIDAAVMLVEGKNKIVSPTTNTTTPLTPQTPQPGTTSAKVKHAGSATGDGGLMNNAKFLNGARAILAR